MIEMSNQELMGYLDTLTRPKQKVVPWVWGHPGVGKSAMVKQLAAQRGVPLVDLRLALMPDPGDLTGLPFAENGFTHYLPPRWWPIHGEGILFLDELNRAREDVLNAVMQLVHSSDRSVGDRKLPEGWSIVVAGNMGEEDKTMVKEGDAALGSRFWHVKLKPDFGEWSQYMRSQHRDARVLNFLAAQHQKFWINPPELNGQFPCPRTWDLLAQVIEDVKDLNVIYSFGIGLVGSVATVAFQRFLQENTDVTPEAILKAWDKKTEKLQTTMRDKLLDMQKTKTDLFYNVTESTVQIVAEKKKVPASEIAVVLELLLEIAGKDHAIALARYLASKYPESALGKKIFEQQVIRNMVAGMVS